MTKLQSRGRAVALLATAALALSACGSDETNGLQEGATPPATTGTDSSASAPAGGGGTLSGTLNGGGASSQESAMDAWRSGFQTANPGVTVNYDPAGSSGGREQFLNGGLAFAGSDAALSEEERATGKTRCTGGDAIEFPLYISPIAVIYNLEGVETLNLSPAVLGDIFNNVITTWNDPAIVALNEGTELPDTTITPVHRSDGSGTTDNFTDYLAVTAAATWPYEADSEWPVDGGEAGDGTSGMVSAVEGGDGTIGYADFSRAGELGVANIQVGSEFVAPTPEGAAKVIESAPREEGLPDGDVTLEIPRDTTDPTSYPVTLTAYSIVCSTYPDAAEAALVKGFFTYVASPEGQAAAAEEAGSAPISDALRTDVLAAVESITAGS